jgi:cell wall assembly regulator SMI1
MLIDIPSTLVRVGAAISALGGDVAVLEVGPPATEAQVQDVERDVGRRLPMELRGVFTEQSSRLRMHWIMKAGGRLPDVLGNGLSGYVDLSLEELPEALLNWSGWRSTFETPAAYDWPADLTVELYERLFPLMAATNGDQIVIAEPDDPANEVVYLDHEGGDFNLVVLADTLEDFLNTWFSLGCPGPEWWGLAPFLDPRTTKLSLKTRRSKAWLRAMASAVGQA